MVDNKTVDSVAKNKKKDGKKRRNKKSGSKPHPDQIIYSESSTPTSPNLNGKVEVEYVPQGLDIDEEDPLYYEFSDAFEKLARLDVDNEDFQTLDNYGFAVGDNDGSGNSEDEEGEVKQPTLSKKKLRKLNRLSISALKQQTKKPEVVEWVDVTASDPKLLVYLKGCRNTVPVPRHWSQKRKYLQGKRGVEKPPFELPSFIKDTGIMEMRAAVKEKEDHAKLRSKARERMQPRMGRLDIDYQRLHDAFFRYQTKPYLTMHGELYYEGKEFEAKLKDKKPGNLSEALKAALNIPPLAPPPWLINMQRYGPPPSYPNLIIAGLNAPIPLGATWGFHPGGWGKPPVDEFNNPLYGDVFNTNSFGRIDENAEPVERTLWGEMDSEDEHVDMEEEEIEEEEEVDDDEQPVEVETQPEELGGLITPSGLISVASGLETPKEIELRKDSRRTVEHDGPKHLYQVLPQKDTSVRGFMGSQYTYDTAALTNEDDGSNRRNETSSASTNSQDDSNYSEPQERPTKLAKVDLSDLASQAEAKKSQQKKPKVNKEFVYKF